MGVAAAKQERTKEGMYNEAAAAEGIRFTPFAMEVKLPPRRSSPCLARVENTVHTGSPLARRA